MSYLHKIDKDLLSMISVMEDSKTVECLVHARDFEAARNFFILKGIKITGEYQFINLFGVRAEKRKLFDLCGENCISYISRQVQVKSLMNVARKILSIEGIYTGNNVTVCYIDTGISPHLDFTLGENRIIRFVDMVANKKVPYDDNGHGTFVAGVGSGSGLRSLKKTSGIAPGSRIISIKALNRDGEANALKILDAMQWVYENRVRYNISIVCMSFGSEPLGSSDPIMKGAEELWKSGITVVAAAGNSGPEYETIKSPGISPLVITVGGLNDNRLNDDEFKTNFFEVAAFSSRGPALRRNKPDLLAPAVNIVSCGQDRYNPYKRLSGTSVATPMIAGICALMLEKNPNLKPDQIKYRLLSSCSSITYMRNLEGYGIPNCSKLLNEI